MNDKFVVQVACGQQHSVCRAVDRTGADVQTPLVGSDVGADVYVWGNGTLGQLGLGELFLLCSYLYFEVSGLQVKNVAIKFYVYSR